MGSSVKVEEAYDVHNDYVDEPATIKTPTWLARVTNFVAHWGVETNGSVFPPEG